MCTLKTLLCSLALASAHVTFDPNAGFASGHRWVTKFKVPHGHMKDDGTHLITTMIDLFVPKGVRKATPEQLSGWNTTITYRALSEAEQYPSHGRTVKTAPHKITWHAITPEDGLHNLHLLTVTLSTQAGCTFTTAQETATTWNGKTTLWWPVHQYSSHEGTFDNYYVAHWANVGDWADCEKGTDAPCAHYDNHETGQFGDKQYPCPYTYIHPGSAVRGCDFTAEEADADAAVTGGMMWLGKYMPHDPNGEDVTDIEHVLDLIGAETSHLTAMEGTVKDAHDDANQALAIAIAGVALATAALGFLFSLCLFRITAKQSFAEIVSAVPLTSTYADKAGAANKA